MTNRAILLTGAEVNVSSGQTNLTYGVTEECPDDFELVRIAVHNADTTAVTVKGFVAASAAGLGVPDQPIVPITWNGVSSVAAAAAASGRGWSSGRTADDGGFASVPAITYSDWMYCSSVPQTSGRELPLLHWRLHVTTTGNLSRFITTNYVWENQAPWTRRRYSYFKAGDSSTAAAWSAYASPTDQTARFFSAHAEVFTRNRCTVVMGVGDSIMKGTGTISHMSGYGRMACDAVSTKDFPMVFVNTGWGGSKHKHWTATDLPGGTSIVSAGNTGMSKFEKHLLEFTPDIVVIPTWSPNNAASATNPTAAEMSAALGLTLYMVQLCESYGAKPILVSPYPRDSLTVAGKIALVNYANTVVRVFKRYPVLDLFSAWGNSTGGFDARMQSDGVHASQFANELAAKELIPILKSLR